MSAQVPIATLPNGVQANDAQDARTSGGASLEDTEPRPKATPEGSGVQPQASEQRPDVAVSPKLQMRGAENAHSGLETIATATQVEPKRPSTMSDVGGRSDPDRSAAAHQAAERYGGYTTPRSTTSSRGGSQPAWLAGMEVPRWVLRLGNLLQPGTQGVIASDLAPSPFPSGSPALTPPPGGPAFRLRSPQRARAIPPAPSPPSSSSLPAEAIQQEVQRQLQGVMMQLREYGEANQRLHAELLETRAMLREEQSRNATCQQPTLPTGSLLGDLAEASMDPGVLQGAPVPPESVPLPRLDSQVPLREDATLSRPAGLPPPRGRVSGHGGDPDSGLPRGEGFLGSGVSEEKAQDPSGQRSTTLEASTGLLRSWWENRGRSQTPPPPPVPSEPQGSPVLEALARGVQQLQELQAQALSKATSSTTTADIVKPGSPSLLPMPEARTGADSAVTFQDWLEVSSSVMGDLSESSSLWWHGVIEMVQNTYERWLSASPLERINVEPVGTDKWTTGKWLRVNARASIMLLSPMPEDLRVDIVSRRATQDCGRMLFRAFTYYQPGGSAERQDVLKRLQNPLEYAGGESLEAALKAVRAWPRWLERCNAVKMSPPDASVLARGLLTLTDRHINASADAAFRTSMLRTTLRLDACPTTDQVQAYQRHLQAELEAMIVSRTGTSALAPAVKAVEPALQPKARDAGGVKGGSGELCRYFMKSSGCRRGEKCTFSHNMSGLDREQRAKKCLRCGSESHRQKDCTVGRAVPKGTGGGSPTSGNKDQKPPRKAEDRPSSSQSTMASVGTSSTTSSNSDPVQGTPWTLEALVQAAQQLVQAQSGDRPGEQSPEKTRPEVKVIRLRDVRICSLKATATALVDSGATHSLRSARSLDEWDAAEEVMVHLAGNHQLPMRITPGGALLMPFRGSEDDVLIGDKSRPQTIVPMGQLIQTLGYTMFWGPTECYLTSPEGEKFVLQTDGGCPQMREMEALSLIARLEDKKLEQLHNETLTTKDKLAISAVVLDRPWSHYLYDYVSTGSFESGLRAVRDAPFFADLPGECISDLIPPAGLWSGWGIMKEIGFLSRPQRRKLWNSKRWVVHLFSGGTGHWEIYKLDQNETTVLELDVDRCAGQDITRSEVWRMLLWGAKEGKVDVVLGGPPGRAQQYTKGGTRDAKPLKLIARMMWLFMVAEVGRELNGAGSTKDREVGFIMEYPEGIPPELQERRRREADEADAAYRSADDRGSPATWSQTNAYWENVQRPRWEDYAGVNTVDARASFWDTRMWKLFQQEASLRIVSFDQGAMGGESRNRTTLGTNVHNLLSLDGLRLPDGDPLPDQGPRDHIWAPGLVNALVVALSFWERDARSAPRIRAMTPEKWKEHVDSNHAVYRKDCLTCVMGRGIGRQHRRNSPPGSICIDCRCGRTLESWVGFNFERHLREELEVPLGRQIHRSQGLCA